MSIWPCRDLRVAGWSTIGVHHKASSSKAISKRQASAMAATEAGKRASVRHWFLARMASYTRRGVFCKWLFRLLLKCWLAGTPVSILCVPQPSQLELQQQTKWICPLAGHLLNPPDFFYFLFLFVRVYLEYLKRNLSFISKPLSLLLMYATVHFAIGLVFISFNYLCYLFSCNLKRRSAQSRKIIEKLSKSSVRPSVDPAYTTFPISFCANRGLLNRFSTAPRRNPIYQST